jgi:phosphonate transport system substrate-binding protein
MSDTTLLMGAVAYDPKVVTIWDGFRRWFAEQSFAFDYVLYSHYERQVTDLVDGHIDAAWNSPLAWIRTRRLATAAGVEVAPLVMRDTDRDLRSVVVVRHDSEVEDLTGLRGRTVATGAVDSPQATLLPLSLLRAHGLDPDTDLAVRRFDVGVGLHGDHVGGERDAARALAAGEVDAACMLDANHLLFTHEGTLSTGSTRILAATPVYDHCNLTVRDGAPDVDRFASLLRSMSYDDPEVRTLLELEGLRSWEDGRSTGYGDLERAVDESGFYDASGRVTAKEYTP